MEVIVLDNGLVDRGAHSFHMAKALGGELASRGIPYRVFGARKMVPEVAEETGAVPFFRRYLYESIHRSKLSQALLGGLNALAKPSSTPQALPPQSEALTFRTLSRDYRRDLERIPDIWQADNLVLVTGASHNELFGLVTHLLSLDPAQRPAVICQLMFNPTWTSWGAQSARGAASYARIFKLATPLVGRCLFFVCETSSAARCYADTFQVTVGALPIPLAGDMVPRATRPHGPRVRFGYFGYSKTAKGFHLLPKAIEICEERGLEVEFVVQANHTEWEPAVVAADRALGSSSLVKLVRGALSSEDYYDLFGQVDAILLPYDPKEYGQRGSGILVEAVCSGRPVVASSGTWAASEILEGRAAGQIMVAFDSGALAEAIERLTRGIPAARERAGNCAEAFASRHSPETYVSELIRIAEARTPSAPVRQRSGFPR